VSELTFLGTGNFLAPPGRYWNAFVLDGHVLVEPSPTALPNLRKCGFAVEAIDVVVLSHFHADHCFGWPFLLEAAAEIGGGRTVHVVGPPGVEQWLADLNEAGAVGGVTAMARERLDLRFVEATATGQWQEAGPLRFRAVEVEHVPYLRCFGYLFERGERVVAYSGDVKPCAGLTELAQESDVLVLECNGRHDGPPSHMHEGSVQELAAQHPGLHIIVTHLGEQVDVAKLEGITVPSDFERLTV
jgi:ribonuclease BN (tRNA processing enzyme)